MLTISEEQKEGYNNNSRLTQDVIHKWQLILVPLNKVLK